MIYHPHKDKHIDISGGVCISGYFNPLHKGHLKLINYAYNLCSRLSSHNDRCNRLSVIVNNDNQVKLKGSIVLQDENERLEIINSLGVVSYSVLSIDQDRTIAKTLDILKPIFFVNAGDVTDLPPEELEVCRKNKIFVVFCPFLNKIQSSSDIKSKLLETSKIAFTDQYMSPDKFPSTFSQINRNDT